MLLQAFDFVKTSARQVDAVYLAIYLYIKWKDCQAKAKKISQYFLFGFNF